MLRREKQKPEKGFQPNAESYQQLPKKWDETLLHFYARNYFC